VPGHEAQVEKAQKILKDTADMVIDLAKQVRDLLGEGS
jgi:hypothetical protein